MRTAISKSAEKRKGNVSGTIRKNAGASAAYLCGSPHLIQCLFRDGIFLDPPYYYVGGNRSDFAVHSEAYPVSEDMQEGI